MNSEEKSLKYYLMIATLCWFIGVLVALMFVFVFTLKADGLFVSYDSTGQIGDTIGGISSPFIGVSAAVLTFLAFYMQLKANAMHSRQFAEQSRSSEKEKHEDNIFFLIKQNRSIVESMSIADKTGGAKCFTDMCDELRVIYEITSQFYAGELNEDDVANISYLLLFNGVGITSDELNRQLLKQIPRHDELLDTFRGIMLINYSWSGLGQLSSRAIIEELLERLDYKPFDGHLTRLGHYFRNLFHILKYTENVPDSLLSNDRKYEIIKSLRSQLTSFEQIIIYFNAISSYGTPMRNARYIETYQLIKNIPLPAVRFAGDIRKRFPDIEFEWDEIISRSGVSELNNCALEVEKV